MVLVLLMQLYLPIDEDDSSALGAGEDDADARRRSLGEVSSAGENQGSGCPVGRESGRHIQHARKEMTVGSRATGVIVPLVFISSYHYHTQNRKPNNPI